MTDPHISMFTQEAQKILQFLHTELSKLQTGRANAALVEHIDVQAYGQRMPVKNVANISVQDSKTIVIQPWDAAVLPEVEKAISQSDAGLTPNSDGSVIRIILPPMTEERRSQLTKVVHKLCEEARVSVRQQRQHAHDKIKEEKEEDRKHTLLDALQKEVDKVNAEIEEIKKAKDEELMKV